MLLAPSIINTGISNVGKIYSAILEMIFAKSNRYPDTPVYGIMLLFVFVWKMMISEIQIKDDGHV
jgi:hypothetical protein